MEKTISKISQFANKFKNTALNTLQIIGVAVIIVMSFALAKSQVDSIINFPASSFSMHWLGSNGYESPFNGNTNRHRLTQKIPGQATAIWHYQSIDLAKEFIFTFWLHFGNGNGKVSPALADGIVYVMTTSNKYPLIGEPEAAIGYAGYGRISPSIAVEFDTEFNSDSTIEGSDQNFYNEQHISHTAYLKNATINAIPDHNGNSTFKPILGDFYQSVAGKSICVTIVWQLENGKLDGSDGYNLITFINGVEKNNMWFATLSDAISGLTKDNNGRAPVLWGITSATCDQPNQHEIEFGKLWYGNIFTVHIDTNQVNIVWEGNVIGESYDVASYRKESKLLLLVATLMILSITA